MNFETKREHNRPWEHATGPVTIMGKLKSSRNSLKHGYYRETFREFRKNRRKPETIMIEGMCLCLIKASYRGNFEDLSRIVSDLCGSAINIWRSAENKPLESDSLMELKYVFTLCESIIRYSTTNVTRNLNRQLKEQNEKE